MARMVDIGAKPDVDRRATATGEILLRPATIAAIRTGTVEKGDPIHTTAEVAGIQARPGSRGGHATNMLL